MPNYRREPVAGASYFFTVVTRHRRPLFRAPANRSLLRDAVASVRRRLPFFVDAWVLMPDHLHAIWTLPKGDADFSKRWGIIKAEFTRRKRARDGTEPMTAADRWSSPYWQSRFWEHRLRDARDFERHVDYVHWNPVKHGEVERVRDWPWSTFHRYVRQGDLSIDWGDDSPDLGDHTTFGEP